MNKSNCYKKYGKEWSKELADYTMKHLETMLTGYVKHIGGKTEICNRPHLPRNEEVCRPDSGRPERQEDIPVQLH